MSLPIRGSVSDELATLEDAILRGAVLRHATVARSTLEDCRCEKCTVTDCKLDHCIVQQSTISKSLVVDCSVKKCSINEFSFKRNVFEKVDVAPNRLVTVLPPELRTQIYELALSSSYPIKRQVHEYMPDAQEHLTREAARGYEHALAGLSLQLADRLPYEEALPILYRVNTFRIDRRELCPHSALAFASYTHVDRNHLVHLELSDFIVGYSYCSGHWQ